ncbi:testis-expressed basic protein 1 isoform X39 [Peromyscus eremicus]|uniref:testis-expressed basic protein 1 isoform X39 n=1 Tax=Peromyscus eremicus TaxID=42410 RepID=UPI0027DCD7ED|nr:testis-expressed basic protein 1 isoform X39 [Peromyscus eremicus]
MLWSAIPHKEVILAVTLTVLGLVILAILIARWTRRKQNVAQLSRYPSEQSAGLLDYEDGVSCARPKKGRGSRTSCSTESAGNAGHITGTIGPIMQFSAPIPGATGPIRLSQRTIVQTPGPIAQFTESSEEPSQACLPEGSNCAITPVAISCPPSPKAPVCATPASIVRQDPGCDGPEEGLLLEGCRDSLKKRMIGGPNESYTMLHKREIKRRVRPGMGLQCEGEVPMMDQIGASRRRDSPRGQDSQVRFDPGLPPETMWSEPPRYRRPESKMRRTNDAMLKRQGWQGECPVTEHEFEYQYMKTATPPASWPPQRMASNAPPPAARPSKTAAPAPEAQQPPAGGAPAEAPAAPPPEGNPGGEEGDKPKTEKKRRKSQGGEEG